MLIFWSRNSISCKWTVNSHAFFFFFFRMTNEQEKKTNFFFVSKNIGEIEYFGDFFSFVIQFLSHTRFFNLFWSHIKFVNEKIECHSENISFVEDFFFLHTHKHKQLLVDNLKWRTAWELGNYEISKLKFHFI